MTEREKDRMDPQHTDGAPCRPELGLYRRRTIRLLRQYMRTAIDVGRLPSILGREFFRAKVSHRQVVTFEDAVILVHDVERILCRLNQLDEQIIAMMVLQEYSQEETADLLGCARRTVGRRFPEVLDHISEMFLAGKLLEPMAGAEEGVVASAGMEDAGCRDGQSAGCGKACQEGEAGNYPFRTSSNAILFFMAKSNAVLKIERADEHIAEIGKQVSLLPDFYSASMETNPKTGKPAVKYGLSKDAPATSRFGLLIGDAVHNLKCALDYAWLGVMEKKVSAAADRDTKFPVYPTAEHLKAFLKGRKIDVVCESLYDSMVTHIKPYKGGNDSLWAIHQLDKGDKHRLLTPLLQIAFLSGIKVEDKAGQICGRIDVALTRPGPYFFDVPAGSKLKNQGSVGASIIFHEGTPTHDREVLSELTSFSAMALKVVELLEEQAAT